MLEPRLLFPEAKRLFQLLSFLEQSDPERYNRVLAQVVFDLATIASACLCSDSGFFKEELIVIGAFLKYPFLNEQERSTVEAWRLLDDEIKHQFFEQTRSILEQVPKTLPESFLSLTLLAEISAACGQPELVTNCASRLYRFAQLVAKAHGGISDAEALLLEELWKKLLNQEYGVKARPARPEAVAWQGSIRKISARATGKLTEVMQELDSLIGLSQVKEEIRTLANFLTIQESRSKEGLRQVEMNLHAIFSGPPGTGKTTVARLYGKLLKSLGILEEGHVVETDRAGLVAEYVGQTAPKVDAIVREAEGGVLFIDEAYSLKRAEGSADFGSEAVEVLLKRMEDRRNNLVVIAAGYTEEMEEFLSMNPGLSSRFARHIKFPHYTVKELIEIFKRFAAAGDYCLSCEAEEKLEKLCAEQLASAGRSFGNARTMRNLFESAVRRQANRLVKVFPLSRELLQTLEAEDLAE